MATHGTLASFDPSKEDWSSYVLRLKYYFQANGVTDTEKKKSILLTACGPATFRRIGSLLTAARLETIGYAELVEEVKKFYDPKPSTIVQRFQFNTRERTSGESIAAYVAALRKLGEHCSYGDKLNEMIRDRLVCGVNHDTIQPRLLAEKDLTYEKAIEIAQAVEAAEKNAKIIKNGNGKQGIHYSTGAARASGKQPVKQEQKKSQPTCYRCGGPHLAPVCTFKEAICRACQKKGHLAKVCRSKNKPQKTPGTQKNLYVQDAPEEPSEPTYSMFTVRQEAAKPIILDVHINNVPVKMEFDTGASLSILSSNTYHSIEEKSSISPLEESNTHLETYTGQTIPILGKTSVSVRVADQEEVLPIHVVDGAGPNLMGRDWLHKFKINLGEVNHVEEVTQPLQAVLDKHATVFDGSLGCMKDTTVTLEVKSEVKPRFFKPRSVPYMLKGKVEEELDRLVSLGIVSPVKTSRWAAPIVPVLKKNGTIRICGDFKTTYNQVSDTESYPLATSNRRVVQ